MMQHKESDFRRDVNVITDYVEEELSHEAETPGHSDRRHRVRGIEEGSLFDISRRLKEHLDHAGSGFDACVDRMLLAAGDLMSRSEGQDDNESNIVDMLSAAWLGLYFLGVTFNDPWERACCIADTLGGFPSGACVNKAVGDIYRNARHAHLRRSDTDVNEVVVLTRRPFLYIPLRRLPQPRHGAVHTRLGRCYVSLQLRLYLHSGLPIRYFIPQMALREHLRDYGPAEMARWFHVMLGEVRANQHIEVATAPRTTGGIPTCVLGWNEGVYTLEPGTEDAAEDAPIAGSRLSAALAMSYRQKLLTAPMERLHQLIPEPFTLEMLANVLDAWLVAEGFSALGE